MSKARPIFDPGDRRDITRDEYYSGRKLSWLRCALVNSHNGALRCAEPGCNAIALVGNYCTEHRIDRRCPLVYRDRFCRATSPLTFCRKTFTDCKERDNLERWAGVGPYMP